MIKITNKIHISWKDKNILESKSLFVRNCIGKLVELADGWIPEISDDYDIEKYLKDNLSGADYKLLEDRHIVEKSDVWRLIKMFNEGGLYCDIDRLCNTSINDIIKPETSVVLPECNGSDFSQDFMCSGPNNPMFLETLKLNLERRRMGYHNVYLLGPQTYFHGVTKSITGDMIEVNPEPETLKAIRDIISESRFCVTYIENPPYDTIIYRPENPQISFDHEAEKRKFYAEHNMKHWTGDW